MKIPSLIIPDSRTFHVDQLEVDIWEVKDLNQQFLGDIIGPDDVMEYVEILFQE